MQRSGRGVGKNNMKGGGEEKRPSFALEEGKRKKEETKRIGAPGPLKKFREVRDETNFGEEGRGGKEVRDSLFIRPMKSLYLTGRREGKKGEEELRKEGRKSVKIE